ncbi:flagellar hook-basal body complex protein FliE [Oxalobacter vibrioformis]|uniref:Flagellar hook-basal body complex protein FliE n=1 Tax=Oxalobacter vibrioformis TaxID=933080 RepID=A0A9E9LVM6_9BURK|nr:flagellar hook-basal body complex protein FliE [Oxalobacter vibrioformis]NLC24700.1 flagellar hook-basal body complex protein FliE [Oxalobacter sp.]WAW09557.1 flagellar hook-basal body complex protein FliE [Oxalobacter vibrioformis]
MMAINTNQIQAMLEQIRGTASQVTPPSNRVQNIADQLVNETDKTQATGKSDFASALRATLDSVNELQVNSEQLGEQFALGNDDVQLSDVMISMQKASIALQTTVQARNRLVSAYQEIMGMQI